jgi:hypothetical protein
MKDRYEIDGRFWIPVGRAARLIGTNAAGLKKLMADGTLDWTQSRANSRILVVDEEAVLRLRGEREQWRKEGGHKREPKKPLPVSLEMERGTMPSLRARLRNQIEIVPPAPDGGAPGRRR